MPTILALIKLLPIAGSLIVAAFIILSSVGDAAQGDGAALIKGIGSVITGGQENMVKSVDQILSGDIGGFWGLAGSLLLTFSVLKFFAWLTDKFLSFEAAVIQWSAAFSIFAVISFVFYILSVGVTFDNIDEKFQDIVPFKGIIHLVVNLREIIDPVRPYGEALVDESVKSPFF